MEHPGQVPHLQAGQAQALRHSQGSEFVNFRLFLKLLHYSGLIQICDSYSLEDREYFFDRSPRNFDAILGLYRNGKLHLAAGVSGWLTRFNKLDKMSPKIAKHC